MILAGPFQLGSSWDSVEDMTHPLGGRRRQRNLWKKIPSLLFEVFIPAKERVWAPLRAHCDSSEHLTRDFP